jgi:hypothetical protein
MSSTVEITIYGRRLKEDEVTHFPLYPLPRALLGSSHWNSAPFGAPQGRQSDFLLTFYQYTLENVLWGKQRRADNENISMMFHSLSAHFPYVDSSLSSFFLSVASAL